MMDYTQACQRWKSWKTAFDKGEVQMMFFHRIYVDPFNSAEADITVLEQHAKPFTKVVVYNKQDVPEVPKSLMKFGSWLGVQTGEAPWPPAVVPPQTDWQSLYNQVMGADAPAGVEF
jgi:hypothetical protein